MEPSQVQPQPQPQPQPLQQQQAQPQEKISAKLSHRITHLSSAASKESIQTLAKWISFHLLHHPLAIQQTLLHFTTKPSTSYPAGAAMHHLVATWNILHELCIMDAPSATDADSSPAVTGVASNALLKGTWSNHKDFRESLGESVICPALEYFLQCHDRIVSIKDDKDGDGDQKVLWDAWVAMREKIQSMLGVWQELDCFESPTLLAEMKRLVVKMFQVTGSGSGQQKEVMNVVDKEKQEFQLSKTEIQKKEMDMSMDMDTDMKEEKGEYTSLDMTHDEDKNVDIQDGSDGGHEKENSESNQKSMQSLHRLKKNESSSLTENASMDFEQEFETFQSDHDDKDVITDKANDEDDDDNDNEEGNEEEEVNQRDSTTHKKKDAASSVTGPIFDFEKEGIPEEPVPIQELLKACKAVATLQITRDMRHDSSHNLISVLSSVPQNVLDVCRVEKEKREKKVQVDASAKGEEGENETDSHAVESLVDGTILPNISDEVLDLDMSRSLANVKLHREIILKQRQFKKECIDFLIQSRCKFGSVEAATLFYDLDEMQDKLKKRKALILDAMELEGIDAEALEGGNTTDEGNDKNEDNDGDRNGKENEEDSAENIFSWFTRQDAKKQKVEV